MSDRRVDFLLIGGGMAAGALRRRAAQARAPRARSCWSGASREPPYERPPLSKEYLRGEAEREDAYVNAGRAGTRRTRSSC